MYSNGLKNKRRFPKYKSHSVRQFNNEMQTGYNGKRNKLSLVHQNKGENRDRDSEVRLLAEMICLFT